MTEHGVSSGIVPAQSHTRRSRRRFVWVTLLLLVLCSLSAWFYYCFLADRGLSDAMTEADQLDPGWRLEDLEAARPTVPEAENGAPFVLSADSLLPKRWLVSSPNVEDQIRKISPVVQLNEALRRELRAALIQAKPALVPARQLENFPRGRFVINWGPDYIGTLIPHTGAANNVARLLYLDAIMQAQEGDVDRALASCQAALNAGRSFGDEPVLISQLFRVSCQAWTLRGIQGTLAQGAPSPVALEKLQHLLEDESSQPLLLWGTRGERALMHGFLGVIKARRFNRRTYMLRNPLSAPDQAVNFVDAVAARGSHAAYLRYLTEFVEIAKLPPKQRNARLEQLQRPKAELPGIAAALNREDDRAMARRFLNVQALLRCAAAALAVERYRQAKRHWRRS